VSAQPSAARAPGSRSPAASRARAGADLRARSPAQVNSIPGVSCGRQPERARGSVVRRSQLSVSSPYSRTNCRRDRLRIGNCVARLRFLRHDHPFDSEPVVRRPGGLCRSLTARDRLFGRVDGRRAVRGCVVSHGATPSDHRSADLHCTTTGPQSDRLTHGDFSPPGGHSRARGACVLEAHEHRRARNREFTRASCSGDLRRARPTGAVVQLSERAGPSADRFSRSGGRRRKFSRIRPAARKILARPPVLIPTKNHQRDPSDSSKARTLRTELGQRSGIPTPVAEQMVFQTDESRDSGHSDAIPDTRSVRAHEASRCW
jgi:hypothetical protein